MMKSLLWVFIATTITKVLLAAINPAKDTICNKETFIKRYVNTDKPIGDDQLNLISRTCLNHCKGDVPLTLVYGQNKNGQYILLVEMKNLVTDDTKDCWGFILKISDDVSNITHYINFKNKTNAFSHFHPVVGGRIYTFTLSSPPSQKQESISLKAPGECENRMLLALLEQSNKENVFGDCAIPDIQAKIGYVKRICDDKRLHNDEERRTKITFNKTKCSFVFDDTVDRISVLNTEYEYDLCSKTSFIKNYVEKDRNLQQDVANQIKGQCQLTNQQCQGTNNLEIIYAENIETGNYVFMLRSLHLQDSNAKPCWGFVLQIYDNGEQKSQYFNFKEKSENFTYVQPAIVGHAYKFVLISLPSGLEEKLSVTAPDKCGNKLLVILESKSDDPTWKKGCSEDLKANLNIVEKFCKGVRNEDDYEKYKNDITVNATTCEYVLPTAIKQNYDDKFNNFKDSSASRLFHSMHYQTSFILTCCALLSMLISK